MMGPFRNHGFGFGFVFMAPFLVWSPERVREAAQLPKQPIASLSRIWNRSRSFEKDRNLPYVHFLSQMVVNDVICNPSIWEKKIFRWEQTRGVWVKRMWHRPLLDYVFRCTTVYHFIYRSYIHILLVSRTYWTYLLQKRCRNLNTRNVHRSLKPSSTFLNWIASWFEDRNKILSMLVWIC